MSKSNFDNMKILNFENLDFTPLKNLNLKNLDLIIKKLFKTIL